MSGIRNSGLMAWLYMMRTFNKIERRSGEQLGQFDLTRAQFEVLAHLSKHAGISQQALSERLLVTKGNVCGLISRMEGRGLVVRCADADDRRLNLLHLTEAGKSLAGEVIPLHEEFIQEQMAGLSEAEQRSLHTLLRRLDRSLDA